MICHFLAEKVTDCCVYREDMEMAEKESVMYGIELFLETIWKSIALLIIGFITGNMLELIISVCSYSVLRYYAGGKHMKTSIGCFSFMVLVGLLPAYLAKTIHLSYITGIILLLFCYFIVRKYAPCATQNNPITDKEIRQRNNRNSQIIIGMAALCMLLPIKNIIILIAIPILIETITILQMKKEK